MHTHFTASKVRVVKMKNTTRGFDAQYRGLRANAAPSAGVLVCFAIAGELDGHECSAKHSGVVCMIAYQFGVQRVLLGMRAALHRHTIAQTAYWTSSCGLTL
jgi:hypothetical protein